MSADFPIILLVNGFTLALATAFLLIVLWYDIRRSVNQFFAIFLVLVQIWNVGILLTEITVLIDSNQFLLNLGYALSQSGFIGASVSLYALLTVIAGLQPRRFYLFTLLYLALGVAYSILLATTPDVAATTPQSRIFSAVFFAGFGSLILYVISRYRRKFNSPMLIAGMLLFLLGQGSTFLNPELGIAILASTFAAFGTLLIGFAIVRRELINPLIERGTQLESMHEVSVSISSQFTTDTVLNDITQQAANWLQADAAGIFLKENNKLRLVSIHNLPNRVLGTEMPLGEGITGQVAAQNQSIFLENYKRDWAYEDEFPFARETFGSVVCVPLMYDERVIGVLMVISGVSGTLLEKDDVRLLELLAAQAAVAISFGNLFTEQRLLTTQLINTNEQLQKVLLSTENPVLAVDRNLNLIFTNSAAKEIFHLDTIHSRANLSKAIPDHALPVNYREALQSIKKRGTYRYEIEIDEQTYLCHVAGLGLRERVDGFVAVMNDVSELKELDRIKSEMVRMTSHDLKNPLQAAFANLELLRDDVETINDDEMTLSVDNIERQLNKMHRIISGILDLERVRMGSNLNQVCHPQDVIQEAVDELEDIAQEKGIILETDVHENVASFLGDSDQFKRAIVNIIENAIKFNEAGGEVLIRAMNRGSQIFITVSDDGIGIPSELHPKIFERFYRGHQAGAEHISGSGLGLSLVKAVIESHNGQIWVRSQPNVGTTFSITIPAVRQEVDLPT